MYHGKRSIFFALTALLLGCGGDGGGSSTGVDSSEQTQVPDQPTVTAEYSNILGDPTIMSLNYDNIVTITSIGEKAQDTGLATSLTHDVMKLPDNTKAIISYKDKAITLQLEDGSFVETIVENDATQITFYDSESGQKFIVTDDTTEDEDIPSSSNSHIARTRNSNFNNELPLLPHVITPKALAGDYFEATVNVCSAPVESSNAAILTAEIESQNVGVVPLPLVFVGNGVYRSQHKLEPLQNPNYQLSVDEYAETVIDKSFAVCSTDVAVDTTANIIASKVEGITSLIDTYADILSGDIKNDMLRLGDSLTKQQLPSKQAITLGKLVKIVEDAVKGAEGDPSTENLRKKLKILSATRVVYELAKCHSYKELEVSEYITKKLASNLLDENYSISVLAFRNGDRQLKKTFVQDLQVSPMTFDFTAEPSIDKLTPIPSFVRKNQQYRMFVDVSCMSPNVDIKYVVKGTDNYEDSGNLYASGSSYIVPGAEESGVVDTNSVYLYKDGKLIDSERVKVTFK